MQAPPIPQAAAPPQQPQPLGITVLPNTYAEKYRDPQTDSLGGNYINLCNEYAVGNTQPAALRNATYRAGNVGTLLHGLVHIREVGAAPDDPGTIVALHRLTRPESLIGQAPLPFANLGLAYFGDVINGQAPATVHVPDAWFNQTVPVQVPSHGLLGQQFAAHPADETFGPFQASDPNIDVITTQQIVLVPNKYALPCITTGLSLRNAYLAIKGLVQQAEDEVACEPLLDWLRATLTLRGGANPLPVTVVHPTGPPLFANPHTQQAFAAYRLSVFHQDFLHFQPGHQHQSAALIAKGISDLTAEQRN